MTTAPKVREAKPFSAGVSARVVGMVVVFIVVICGTVILTDGVSPRDRHPVVAGR